MRGSERPPAMSMARPRKRNQRRKRSWEELPCSWLSRIGVQNCANHRITKDAKQQHHQGNPLSLRQSPSKFQSHFSQNQKQNNSAINMEACYSLAKGIPSRRNTSGSTIISVFKYQSRTTVTKSCARTKTDVDQQVIVDPEINPKFLIKSSNTGIGIEACSTMVLEKLAICPQKNEIRATPFTLPRKQLHVGQI